MTATLSSTLTDAEIARARAAIPVLSRRLELNTGTKGLTPVPVIEAMNELSRQNDLDSYTGYLEVQRKACEARNRLAYLLGTDEDELAFTDNASHSLNIAAMGLRWEAMRPAPGRPVDVLISDHEYPTTNMIFHYLEQVGKVRLIRFRLSADTAEMMESLESVATDESKVLVASHVDCNTGLRADVTTLSQWCRARGVISYIDGAQAVGQFPIDIHAIGCDLYISNGHKWLYGPSGVGLLYVRRGFEEKLEPLQIGSGTIVFGLPVQWTPGANRFELTATRPANVYAAMDTALNWLESFGLDRIEARQRELTAWVKERIGEMADRFRLIVPGEWENSSALATIQIHGKTGTEIAEFCGKMLRDGRAFLRPVPEFDGLRLSMAYYNIPDEYEQFFQLVEEML